MEQLWIDFLNSDWHDWRGSGRSEDRLEKPEFVAAFLSGSGLPPLPYPEPDELIRLRALRGLLREQAERLAAGRPLQPGLTEQVNALLEAVPVTRRLAEEPGGNGEDEAEGGRFRIELVPTRRSWAGIMADIAASFSEMLAAGGGSRIRICGNPDCLWVFSDDTRSRTKRYCDDKYCGNLMKVRRFRTRSKERQLKRDP